MDSNIEASAESESSLTDITISSLDDESLQENTAEDSDSYIE